MVQTKAHWAGWSETFVLAEEHGLKNSSNLFLLSQNCDKSIGDCTLFIEGTGLEIFIKGILQSPCPFKEHDKNILVLYATPGKKFMSLILKKFLYLSGKVLLLFEALNFQKEINSKRYTSIIEQSY